MNSKRERRVMLAILPVVLLVCMVLLYLRTFYRYHVFQVVEIESQTGEWDLRDVDFTDTIVKVVGKVSYIPGEVLTPEDFSKRKDEVRAGKIGGKVEVNTSRLRIRMPEDRTYMLTRSSIDYAHRLFINGEQRGAAGTPAETAEEFVPGYAMLILETRPEDQTIEIVQQAANFVHKRGGYHDGYFIGLPDAVRQFVNLQTGMEMLTVGVFLALFLVHFTLFFVFRLYKSNFVFALLCLMWFARTGLTGTKVFYSVFPALPWQIAFRTEYITLPAACILILLLLKELFPEILAPGVRRCVIFVSGAYIASFLVVDTLWMSYALVVYYVIFSVTILYTCVRFAIKLPGMVREGTMLTEHSVALAALVIFMFAAVHDALYYSTIYLFGIDFPLTDAAMLIFAFFQMTANFYGTMREIRAAREKERLMAAEKDLVDKMSQLKNGFYADISHEMKTPLTVIAANAQFAAQNIEAGVVDEETIVDLNAISAEAKRLGQMVTSLVNLNRMQDDGAEYSTFILDSMIRDTTQMYQSMFMRKKNTLLVNIESDLPGVWGNADRLTQVLINLLSNANRHTQGGEISIHADYADGFVRVKVDDNGEGIEKELLEHVFERFSRGAEDGTGLGLSICKTIIEEHGGEIGIASEMGRGTSVWFMLPVKEEEINEGNRNHSACGG